MLSTIIKKEIQNNILSFRFLLTFILLIIIVAVTVFILTNDYMRKIDEYSRRQIEIENYMKKYAHFNRVNNIVRPSQPPIPFYAFIRGLSSDINIEEFDNDPLPVMFPLMDLTFIVTILMSLIAIVFSYDAICGEKEEGTLKLILSNKLLKSKIILSKIIGGILTLLIPFSFSLIIGLLIINLNPRVEWEGADLIALALIILGSILYFTFFYCIGIFISSRHHSSSSSIMTSLFAWVLLVLIIPNLSPYLASFLVKTPSKIKVQREVYRITQIERNKVLNKMWEERKAELYKKYPILDENKNLSRAEQQRKVAEDPAYKKASQIFTEEWEKTVDEANRIQEEKADAIRGELNRKEEAQTILSAIISMISPMPNFTYLATDLSSVGIRNMMYFNKEATRKWWQDFENYKSKKFTELQKKNPAVDWFNTPVDMSDRPRFQYRQEPLVNKIKWTIPFFTVLVIYNLIFFISAYFSFIKYDVR